MCICVRYVYMCALCVIICCQNVKWKLDQKAVVALDLRISGCVQSRLIEKLAILEQEEDRDGAAMDY